MAACASTSENSSLTETRPPNTPTQEQKGHKRAATTEHATPIKKKLTMKNKATAAGGPKQHGALYLMTDKDGDAEALFMPAFCTYEMNTNKKKLQSWEGTMWNFASLKAYDGTLIHKTHKDSFVKHAFPSFIPGYSQEFYEGLFDYIKPLVTHHGRDARNGGGFGFYGNDKLREILEIEDWDSDFPILKARLAELGAGVTEIIHFTVQS